MTSFATTNLDNLLILVFLLGNAPHARVSVLMGFMVSVILVVTVSAIGLALGTIINPSLVGYLGFAPLTLGCYLLYQQRTSAAGKPDNSLQTITGKGRIWLASVVLMFSNSADSIAVLLPLLAESELTSTKLIVVIYLLAIIFL